MGVGVGLSWRASAGKPASWESSLEGDGGLISGLFTTEGSLPYCSADGASVEYGERWGEAGSMDIALSEASAAE